MRRRIIQAGSTWLFAVATSIAAEVPAVPVPPSPYLPVIYRFADTLVEHGRDVYGSTQTGLLLNTIDHAALTNRPPWTAETAASYGAGKKQHAMVNPQHDQNLLRLLYTLSQLSGRPKYRDAANAELKHLLALEPTGAVRVLMRQDATWDVLADKLAESRSTVFFKPASWYRPWMLWEQCFVMDPAATAQITGVLLDNKHSGGPREAGFHMRSYAVAFRHTTNHLFLKALDGLVTAISKEDPGNDLAGALALAIDAEGASHYAPEPVAGRLRDLATRNDKVFCSAKHDLNRGTGFLRQDFDGGGRATTLWGNPWNTTARLGMMCVSRYENTGNIGYRELVHSAADAYFDTDPNKVDDVSPMTMGHVISLQLAAWRSTAQQRYLDRARFFGDCALKIFFDAPLPRANARSERYESTSGTDTLALAMVELHLNILGITAVACPPNTIDR